ncbi:MAG TPA: metallophosphoesterase [Desulfuromonadaceae bacterium]|jgi:hypothetical protein
MSLFLITFLSLYGTLHAYVFLKLNLAFQLSRTAANNLMGIMIIMTIAPVIIRLLERNDFGRSAMVLAWPCYIWMGSLFLNSMTLLLSDVVRLMTWVICRISGSGFPEFLNNRLTCEIALLISLSATVYSFFEARSIRTEHLTVTSSKLPANANRIRIVQISDVHLGLLVREERLQRILSQVISAGPDIFVSTGDLVDGRLNLEGAMAAHGKTAEMLAAIKAPLGRFAVTGNHEYYVGLKQALDFTTKSGFQILHNETALVGEFLSITGIDDPAGKEPGTALDALEAGLLKGTQKERFRLLLKHRPLISKASDGLLDLQLSGHAHQGQLFPFNLLVALRYPLTGGTAKSTAGSLLHVSRGSGTWGPPLRLLAPPEVTVIDIIPEKK